MSGKAKHCCVCQNINTICIQCYGFTQENMDPCDPVSYDPVDYEIVEYEGGENDKPFIEIINEDD